jgi:hypothetical protein
MLVEWLPNGRPLLLRLRVARRRVLVLRRLLLVFLRGIDTSPYE